MITGQEAPDEGQVAVGKAREVLAGLSFTQKMMDGDVGALSGGWKMRVGVARILLMRRHRLARRWYDGDTTARSLA
jgi:ATPase subunit of ABC transporter with duplicated ATPase domains